MNITKIIKLTINSFLHNKKLENNKINSKKKQPEWNIFSLNYNPNIDCNTKKSKI